MTDPTPQPTSGADQPRWTIDSAVEAIRVASFEAPKAGSHTEWAHRIRDILVFLVADVRDHAAVTQERDALRDKLEAWLNGPPSQMSYRGRLIPINSTGMREVIDENARLWEFVRAYDATCEGPNHGPTGCVDGLIAARAALGDTP